MKLINENDLQNVCGGREISFEIDLCTFFCISLVLALTVTQKPKKKAETQPNEQIICKTKTTYYLYNKNKQPKKCM